MIGRPIASAAMALVMAAAVMAAAACAPPTPDGTAASRAPAAGASTDRGAAPLRCDRRAIDLTDAVPIARSRVLQAPKTLPSKPVQTLVHDVGPNGEVLMEVGRKDRPAASVNEPARLHPGELRILDPGTGEVQRLHRKRSRTGTQTVFADLDRTHAVWTEETGTALDASLWKLYAADRSTGRGSQVAAARPVEEVGTAPTVPGYSIPSLDGGRVYWAEARSNPRRGRPPVVHVHGRDLGSREASKVVVPNAIEPVATGGFLYSLAFDPERWGRPEYTVRRTDLRTGATTVIHRGRGPADSGGARFLTAYGRISAWSVGDAILVYEGTREVVRVRAPGRSPEWLHAGERTIGFTDGDEAAGAHYLLDLRAGCTLVRLGRSEGIGETKVGGTTVAWPEPDGDDPQQARWRYSRIRLP